MDSAKLDLGDQDFLPTTMVQFVNKSLIFKLEGFTEIGVLYGDFWTK